MDFPELVPYFLGKAERWPRRDFYDSLVAYVTLARMLPRRCGRSRALREELTPFVDWLESLDITHAALFTPPIDTQALCERFLEAEYIAEEAAGRAARRRLVHRLREYLHDRVGRFGRHVHQSRGVVARLR